MSSVCEIIPIGIEKENHNTPSRKEETWLPPQFVPPTQRYVCKAESCGLMCFEESLLRNHLTTLHSNNDYQCKHCDETISTDKGIINTDFVIQHLRLHDLNLYKCQYCKFVHNLNYKVEQHSVEKHADKTPAVIIVRELQLPVEKFQGLQKEDIKIVISWHCGFCKYYCATKSEMFTHALNKHGSDVQFKCGLCKFRDYQKWMVVVHSEEAHPGQNIKVVHAFYDIIEKSDSSNCSNETVLYDSILLSRRDNSNNKYIGGIAVEEQVTQTKFFMNVDQAIEAMDTNDASDNLLQRQQNEDEIDEDNDESVNVFVDFINQNEIPEDLSAITLDKINKMAINELQNLNGEFGPFGKPLDQYYLCPLCNTFKTREMERFKLHLYDELYYTRFVCTRCGDKSSCLNSMKKHAAEKHIGLPQVIELISPDYQIENWVEKVIAVQRRLLDNTQTPSTSNSKIEYLHKHEKQYWVQKPHRCGYCKFEGVTNPEVLQHLKQAHPNEIPALLIVPTPTEPIIKPISRKRKYKVEPISVNSNTNLMDLQTSIPIFNLTEEDDMEYKEKIYTCSYCSKQSYNKTIIKNHWTQVHKLYYPDFKYETFLNKIEKAKCFYCDYCGEINGMMKHCYTKHASYTFAMLRYKCDLCNKYCYSSDQLKIHYDEIHRIVEIDQEIVEKREGTKKEYSCSYCYVRFNTYHEWVQHHCTLYSHPKLQYERILQYKCPKCFHITNKYCSMIDHLREHAKPFQCFYCPLRVPYSSNVETHIQKEHAGFEACYKSLPEAYELYETWKRNITALITEADSAKHLSSLSQSSIPEKIRITDQTYAAQSSINSATETSTAIRQPNVRQFARKSTTRQSIPKQLKKEIGFSYYGNKPDLDSIENVKSNLLVNDFVLELNMLQMKALFNLSPTVAVIDIQKQ